MKTSKTLLLAALAASIPAFASGETPDTLQPERLEEPDSGWRIGVGLRAAPSVKTKARIDSARVIGAVGRVVPFGKSSVSTTTETTAGADTSSDGNGSRSEEEAVAAAAQRPDGSWEFDNGFIRPDSAGVEGETWNWHFDSAEASFKLLVYRHLGMVQEPFKVLGYRVIEDKTTQGVSVSQATVKLQIGDKISHQVSEGDGPVNALDAALRKALLPFFPNMAKVKLDDYKVRVLGSKVASDATVRVWTTFGDEKGYWNVVGVSSNIIEASWMAFVDGLTYKILVDNKVIESAYKHIDVKSVAAAGQASATKEEETAPAKAKKLSARKVRNLADITRRKR